MTHRLYESPPDDKFETVELTELELPDRNIALPVRVGGCEIGFSSNSPDTKSLNNILK